MLISNPADSSLFVPLFSLVSGLLGGSLALLFATCRFNLRTLAGSVLFKRWYVWLVVALLYGFAVLAGPLGVAALAAFLIWQGLREYSRLVGLPQNYAAVLSATGIAVAPVALLWPDAFYVLPVVFLMASVLQPILLSKTEQGVKHLAFAVLGWAYIAWLLAHMVLLSEHSAMGSVLLLAIGLGTALSDVGAFTAGKLFGAHKLAPRISPNKTWEGAVGNLLGASVGILLLAFVAGGSLAPLQIVVLPVLIAVGSIWGDLFESAIKREFGAKDAGGWLPGFGGLLDRIDSLIIVVPLVYYVSLWAGWLG